MVPLHLQIHVVLPADGLRQQEGRAVVALPDEDQAVRRHGGGDRQQHQHRAQPLPGTPPLPTHSVPRDVQQSPYRLLLLHWRLLLSPLLPAAGHQLLHVQTQGPRQGLQQRHVRVAQSSLPLADRLVRHMEPPSQVLLCQAQLPAALPDKSAQPFLVHVYHLVHSVAQEAKKRNRLAVERPLSPGLRPPRRGMIAQKFSFAEYADKKREVPAPAFEIRDKR